MSDKKDKSFYEFDRNYPALKWFKTKEFDSPDKPESGKLMCPNFLRKLDEARDKAKIPFKINSGYRTKEYNEDLLRRGFKASKKSSHLKGLAADISTRTSKERFLVIVSLMSVGFTRFGIGETFVHVDDDQDKAANVMWHYY